MRTKKEKSILLIILGLSVQIPPLVIVGAMTSNDSQAANTISPALNWIFAILVLIGYLILFIGCGSYIRDKGYSIHWRMLVIASIFGVSILLLMPSKSQASMNYEIEDKSSISQSLKIIDIPEQLLILLLALPVLIYVSFLSLCLAMGWNPKETMDDLVVSEAVNIVWFTSWAMMLLRRFTRSGLKPMRLIQSNKKTNWKYIWKYLLLVLGAKFAFGWSFNSITLYYLSFILPKYVENFINNNGFNSFWQIPLFFIVAVILAPIVEELFFRAFVLCKWSSKWGIISGLWTSSLLFSIYHMRYDVVTLFVSGMIYSFLYYKFQNILVPIACHSFNNFCVCVLWTVDLATQDSFAKNVQITASEYRDLIQPLFSLRVGIAILAALCLLYFFKTSFPKKETDLHMSWS